MRVFTFLQAEIHGVAQYLWIEVIDEVRVACAWGGRIRNGAFTGNFIKRLPSRRADDIVTRHPGGATVAMGLLKGDGGFAFLEVTEEVCGGFAAVVRGACFLFVCVCVCVCCCWWVA